MSYKKCLLYALNATCRDFPRYIPSLLYCCLLYASLIVTGYGCLWLRISCHYNPADSECDVFGGKTCDNGGFKLLFRPFSTSIFRTRCAIPAFRGHLWESWAPFQDFFWTEYCMWSTCIIQKWLDKWNWNWTKSICQITRKHKQPYKREEIYRRKSLHVA
jgi:hypothetical protein